VTQKKLNYYDLIPPRGVPINDSYNPLKCFIEGHNGGGAINYAPFNSGVFKGIKLDKNRIEEYHGCVQCARAFLRSSSIISFMGGGGGIACSLTRFAAAAAGLPDPSITAHSTPTAPTLCGRTRWTSCLARPSRPTAPASPCGARRWVGWLVGG
jgi:hypothetical protein